MKITYQTNINPLNDEETIFAIIDNGDGSFTSMPKSVWDEQQAAKEAQSL